MTAAVRFRVNDYWLIIVGSWSIVPPRIEEGWWRLEVTKSRFSIV
jgi:hypothetical protein